MTARTIDEASIKGLRVGRKFGLLGKPTPRLAERDPTDG